MCRNIFVQHTTSVLSGLGHKKLTCCCLDDSIELVNFSWIVARVLVL